MASYVAMAWISLTHLDLARDVRVAVDILDGRHYPSTGPVFAGRFHLGPVWYYFLALLLKVSGSWLGAMLVLATIASLKFPLAYAAGAAAWSRSAGILWASLLLVPCWGTFEQVYPTHTQLTALFASALILGSVRFYRDRSPRWSFLVGISFSLGIHAHPTVVAFSPLVGVLLAYGYRRKILNAAHLLVLILLIAAPLLPLLFAGSTAKSQMLHSALDFGSYWKSLSIPFDRLLEIAFQVLLGGSLYWAYEIIGVSKLTCALIALLIAGVAVLAFTGAVALYRRRDVYLTAGVGTLVVSVLLVSYLRDFVPFYMAAVPTVVGTGILAAGCDAAGWKGALRNRGLALLHMSALVFYGAALIASSLAIRKGAWPLSLLPLYNIVSEWYQPNPHPNMPAFAIDRNGEWLCRLGPTALHGNEAIHVIHNYLLDTFGRCDNGEIAIGGRDRLRSHWTGISNALAKELGVVGGARIGPLRVLPVKQVVAAPLRFDNARRTPFPPIGLKDGNTSMHLSLSGIESGEVLVITHLALNYDASPKIVVMADGRPLRPVASDAAAFAFACDDCGDAMIDVSIHGRTAQMVDAMLISKSN